MLFWRYARITFHLVRGGLTVLLCYPFLSRLTHERLRERWSQRFLRILGVRLELRGAPIAPGTLLVANHISWLDILVLNAFTPARFVSKAEVRTWPLIGWLAARNGTVFLRRGSRGHARLVNAEIAGLLRAGQIVAVFPEGTTTDGSHVQHFHAALLQPAIDAGCPVQALALRYLDQQGRYTRAAAYDGDLSLGESLSTVLASGGLIAEVTPSIRVEITDTTARRDLAHLLHERIAAVIASAPPPFPPPVDATSGIAVPELPVPPCSPD